MGGVLREPLAGADGVWVVPEQGPALGPKPLSTASSFATACRAPCRAASATLELTQSTRNTSMLRARMKKRIGKVGASSTSAWPPRRLISVVGALEGGDGAAVRCAHA